jgi:outer membrane protein OmpA-like peptidoglycan-associated protein
MNSGSSTTDTKTHATSTTKAEAAHTNKTATISDAQANVVVEEGVVKFYFASGKADLVGNANDALKDLNTGLKAGKKATIFGYHDSTSDLKTNEALPKQRPESVYNSLLVLGINQDLVEMKKPESAHRHR